MKLGFKLAVIGIALFLVFFGTVGESLMIKIPLGMVGVRTQKIRLVNDQGVVRRDYGAGWQRNLWFVDEWSLFDATVQTFHMSATSAHPFQLKSHDGYSLLLDVTIKYRIRKDHAHDVYVRFGAGRAYQPFVENLARDACRSAFGVMRTEQFYQPATRNHATEKARRAMQDSLASKSSIDGKAPAPPAGGTVPESEIEVVDVLIRDVKFDDQYERKIKDKKLADQDIELNKSKGLSAEQKGRTNKILAETEAMVKVIQQSRESTLVKMRADTEQKIARLMADAQKYVTEAKADAELYSSQKDATGILLVKKAEAAGEELRNKAMSGPGGAVLAALDSVRNLNFGDVTFSTLSLDPLDVDSVLRRLGVGSTRTTTR